MTTAPGRATPEAHGPARAGPPGTPQDLRTTRYSDVCGGTDELKRFLAEEPELAATAEGRATLRSLVDDASYMLGRMEVRLREYQAFRDELGRLVQAMRQIEASRLHDSTREAERLHEILGRAGALPVEEVFDRAEAIRQVANDMEGALRRHKEAVIAAGRAYLRVKGPRDWEDGSRDGPRGGAAGAVPVAEPAAPQAPPPGVPEAWLPPSPHREIIVEWLRKGRAALLPDEEVAALPPGPQGREPLVQFEDGGVMPLRAVRWSPELRNFYPLGTAPHPRGLLYRKRDAAPPPP
jgi:hypothetical protein